MIDEADVLDVTKKFKPLFNMLKGGNPLVDTVIETSGRYGAKSFTTGLFVDEATIQYDWKTLYVRFTNVSIKDSIEAEFLQKIELLNHESYYNITDKRVSSRFGEGEIVFKGIKTGSLGQSANLKSLSGFNCLVVDEAEEIPDKETFRKVYYSIRHPSKRNLSILILNQTDKEHWIYEEYFESRGVPDDFNGVVGNVMYINTDYLDLKKGIIPKNIEREYNRLKKDDPDEYNNTILGAWQEDAIGKVYTKSELSYFTMKDFNAELTEYTMGQIDPATSGTDSLSFPIGKCIGNKIYITDVIFSPEDTNYTQPLCVQQIKDHKPNKVYVENNGAGGIFCTNLENECTSTVFISYHQSANKHTKIIANAPFIKKHFVFRSDYEAGSDYDLYMKNLFLYNKDKKLNTKIHDDAPDSTSELAKYYQHELRGHWE